MLAIAAVVMGGVWLFGCEERLIDVKERPVQVVSETVGAGTEARTGDLVTIDYRAILPDGRVVQARTGYRFELGHGRVIVAIDEAVAGMRAGGVRTVQSPPHKHWGRAGYGEGAERIPPKTWLTFEIKLTNIE